MIRVLRAVSFAALLVSFPALAQTGNLSGGSVTATGSTTPRSLAARTAEIVNIRDYGAKCDGSTDDAPFVAAAVTAASAAGKPVYVPPSAQPCMMGSYVLLPAGLTFMGIGAGTATIKARSGNTSSPLLFQFSSNTTLTGLTIDGGGTAFGSGNNVMVAYGGVTPVDNVRIIGNRIQNTRGIAFIASTSVTRVTIDGNSFANIGEYWRTTNLASDRVQAVTFCCGTAANSGGHVISNNWFGRVGLDAISADRLINITVSNNVFALDQLDQLTWPWSGAAPTAFSAGVYCTSDVTRCNVTGNVIDKASGNAIDTVALESVVIGNNTSNSGQAGIGCFSGGAVDTTCMVAGNNIDGTGAWASNQHLGGITVGNGNVASNYKRLTVVGNSVSDAASYGIYARANTTFADLWVDASNNVGGTVAPYLTTGLIPGPNSDTGYSSIVGTTGTITRLRNLPTMDIIVFGAGGAAGTATACGVDVSCSGPGGGGGGGGYYAYNVSWEALGTRACSVTAPAGVAPGGAVAADTTVTCGSVVYRAKAGGAGQNAAVAAATGGGGGGSPLAAGGSGSGGTGGSGGGPNPAAGGSGGNAAGNAGPLQGSGGGGSSSVGVAGAGGNSYGPSGGGAGAGCNAGEPASGSTGGATPMGQATAGISGTSYSNNGAIGGMGGGGGASSKATGGNGGNGATPGGGAGGAGNGCDGVGVAGTSGTSGAGAVYVRQM